LSSTGGIQLTAKSTQSILASLADGEVKASNATNDSNSSNASNATNATEPEPVDTGLDDNSTTPPEFAQIKLLGNNDGRTIMISTTEKEINATLSTHINMKNPNSPKRPRGNKK
jgi:hypothetical protein